MVRKLLRFFDVQSMRVKDCYAAMNFQRFGKKSWNPIMFTPRTKQKQTRFLKLSIFGQKWFSIIFQVDAKPFPQVSGHCHLALTSSKLLPEITASTSQTCIMMPPKATLENHPHRAVFSNSRGFFWDKIGFWFGIFFLDWWTLKLSWTCGNNMCSDFREENTIWGSYLDQTSDWTEFVLDSVSQVNFDDTHFSPTPAVK